MMPFSNGPSWVLIAVACKPTIPPPNIFAFSPTSLAARIMPTESGGYDATNTRSGLVAWILRTMGV